MKLLREHFENVKILTESDKHTGKKSFYIEGIFIQTEKPNKNRRQYCFESMNREIERYTKTYIKENRAFGELGHPDTPTINLERVSHLIKELRADGKDFYGKAKILTTPYGKIVESLLEEGAKIAVSTRGLGSLVAGPNGVNLVQDDFQLATAADIVADPSAPDAFVAGIMEGREWVYEAAKGTWVEKQVEQLYEALPKFTTKQLHETAAKLFSDFMDGITKTGRK
jgi:hypothetical protein